MCANLVNETSDFHSPLTHLWLPGIVMNITVEIENLLRNNVTDVVQAMAKPFCVTKPFCVKEPSCVTKPFGVYYLYTYLCIFIVQKCGGYSLRSLDVILLTVPNVRTEFGKRAFMYSVPLSWNAL
jgi:hypothetical protein